MNVRMILIVIAAVLFALSALRVSGRIDWTPAGFCCLTVALLLT
jgi:hypothetical protein